MRGGRTITEGPAIWVSPNGGSAAGRIGQERPDPSRTENADPGERRAARAAPLRQELEYVTANVTSKKALGSCQRRCRRTLPLREKLAPHYPADALAGRSKSAKALWRASQQGAAAAPPQDAQLRLLIARFAASRRLTQPPVRLDLQISDSAAARTVSLGYA